MPEYMRQEFERYRCRDQQLSYPTPEPSDVCAGYIFSIGAVLQEQALRECRRLVLSVLVLWGVRWGSVAGGGVVGAGAVNRSDAGQDECRHAPSFSGIPVAFLLKSWAQRE